MSRCKFPRDEDYLGNVTRYFVFLVRDVELYETQAPEPLGMFVSHSGMPRDRWFHEGVFYEIVMEVHPSVSSPIKFVPPILVVTPTDESNSSDFEIQIQRFLLTQIES